jgi:hypothetical protein
MLGSGDDVPSGTIKASIATRFPGRQRNNQSVRIKQKGTETCTIIGHRLSTIWFLEPTAFDHSRRRPWLPYHFERPCPDGEGAMSKTPKVPRRNETSQLFLQAGNADGMEEASSFSRT